MNCFILISSGACRDRHVWFSLPGHDTRQRAVRESCMNGGGSEILFRRIVVHTCAYLSSYLHDLWAHCTQVPHFSQPIWGWSQRSSKSGWLFLCCSTYSTSCCGTFENYSTNSQDQSRARNEDREGCQVILQDVGYWERSGDSVLLSSVTRRN